MSSIYYCINDEINRHFLMSYAGIAYRHPVADWVAEEAAKHINIDGLSNGDNVKVSLYHKKQGGKCIGRFMVTVNYNPTYSAKELKE